MAFNEPHTPRLWDGDGTRTVPHPRESDPVRLDDYRCARCGQLVDEPDRLRHTLACGQTPETCCDDCDLANAIEDEAEGVR